MPFESRSESSDAHERHGPLRVQQHCPLRRMHVARDEPSGGETLQDEGELVGIVAAGVAECQSIEHLGAIGVDLQAPEAPQTSVDAGTEGVRWRARGLG
jgi:hypothetical protein